MPEKNGPDATPNSVVNAALTYLTPLRSRLQQPPPGAERFASDIGLAVGNFLQWLQPVAGSWKANEYAEMFQAILSEARAQSESHKFPVRLTEVQDGKITITVSRNDGKPVGPLTISLEGEL